MGTIRIAVHGGAGNDKRNEDGCKKAADAGEHVLRSGHTSLDAVVAAVMALEDDGRFNAGSGSVMCLDGATVEMDAAVMDTRGALGAVACIEQVKNPVRVARAVAVTPHRLLAGRGATAFARRAGFPEYTANNPLAAKQHNELIRDLGKRPDDADATAMRRFWNYDMGWSEAIDRYACDTVGAVALDADGHFAVATSTGGSAPSLLGRVGDTPLIGCGYYAGAHGAIAVTGIGEHIIPHLLARTVYGWLESGTALQQALDRAVGLFPSHIDVGLIGVDKTTAGASSNREMPVDLIHE